jgi:hypothetical protein
VEWVLSSQNFALPSLAADFDGQSVAFQQHVTGLKKKKEQLPPEPNMKCQGNVTVF